MQFAFDQKEILDIITLTVNKDYYEMELMKEKHPENIEIIETRAKENEKLLNEYIKKNQEAKEIIKYIELDLQMKRFYEKHEILTKRKNEMTEKEYAKEIDRYLKQKHLNVELRNKMKKDISIIKLVDALLDYPMIKRHINNLINTSIGIRNTRQKEFEAATKEFKLTTKEKKDIFNLIAKRRDSEYRKSLKTFSQKVKKNPMSRVETMANIVRKQRAAKR